MGCAAWRRGESGDHVAGHCSLGLDLEKKSLVASERDEAARAIWRTELATQPIDQFIFLDESHTNVTFTARCARAPKGQRAHGQVPRNYRDNTTLVAAVQPTGIQAAMTLTGPLDGDAFEAFVRQVLLPTLRPGQILILDNLSVHKRAAVRRLIEECGCQLIFLPPYSPDLNPIELVFAKLKAAIRRAAARTQDALDLAISQALASITKQDIRNSFRHCGYNHPEQPL